MRNVRKSNQLHSYRSVWWHVVENAGLNRTSLKDKIRNLIDLLLLLYTAKTSTWLNNSSHPWHNKKNDSIDVTLRHFRWGIFLTMKHSRRYTSKITAGPQKLVVGKHSSSFCWRPWPVLLKVDCVWTYLPRESNNHDLMGKESRGCV